jgi:NAD(P)-dependent dehydrogenase (short-subunit alcohol dehydrogenase family)
MKTLHEKVCIVTGSTSGIGLVTAKELAKMGAMTVIVARDEKRGKAALDEVTAYSKSDNVDLLMCDFSSQSSIIEFSEQFQRKHGRLDILVNNAGLMSRKRLETPSGIELTFAVNHLGYFLTTNMLLDMLKDTPQSRIIVVSSDLHTHGNIDFKNLMQKQNYHGFTAYCNSKLANILFTYKLANDLKGSDTTINALHPGVIKTKFSIEDRSSNETFPMGIINPEDGAKSTLFLSISENVRDVSGRYFNQMNMEKSSLISYDTNLAEMLWQKSLELTQPHSSYLQ